MDEERRQHCGAIRVRSGLHSGAVVRLAEGEYVIGSSAECDIVLMDPEVAPRHAVLRAFAGAVSIAALDGAVRVNDIPVGEDESAVPLSGDELVSIGPVDVEMDIEASAASMPVPETFRARTVAVVVSAARRLPELSRKAAGSDLVGQVQQRVRGLPPRVRVAGQAAIATVGLVASAVWIGSLIPTEAAEASAGRILERELGQVRSWLAAVPGVSATARNGSLHLEGTIGTARRHDELQTFLGRLESPVQARLTVGERVAGRAELLLGQLGTADLEVTHAGADSYAVEGYGGTETQWEHRRATLLADLPAIGRLDESGLSTLEDVRAGLARRLAGAGLESRVFLTAEDDAVVATGILSFPALRRWNKLAAAFQRRHPAGPRLASRVHDVREVLGFDVRSISYGKPSYVTTDDGRRFMKGSVLPGGYVVRHIGKRALTVAKQGEEFIYALGR